MVKEEDKKEILEQEEATPEKLSSPETEVSPADEKAENTAAETEKEPENEKKEDTDSSKDKRDTRRDDKTGSWKPKTSIGKEVKDGTIVEIDTILDNGKKVQEPEIVDILLPDAKTDLLLIGQAKGKFGGGQRRVFRQTQKKTMEGNKPKFTTVAVVGNENGYVGIGEGSAKETVPAREKAFRNAKLNIFKIRRGCGSWQCGCKTPHTIPFKVVGKCGSVVIELIPAPKGTGLKVEKECAKILTMAGIKDVWSKSSGQTKTKLNLIKAIETALKNLITTKIQPSAVASLGIVEGKIMDEPTEMEDDGRETKSS